MDTADDTRSIGKTGLITGRRFCCALILGFFSVAGLSAVAEKPSNRGEDRVRILILSKHISRLPEGRAGALEFRFKNCELRVGEKRIYADGFEIVRRGDLYSVVSGETRFDSGELTVHPDGPGNTFSVKVNGEVRVYPLPLYIRGLGAVPEVSVEERYNTFAIDSAFSELGSLPQRHIEALYALAHLVRARCSIPWLKGKHDGYDFCDLTCCQSYRGRSGLTFDDPVYIKTENIRSGFYFHSSGGGRLFSESVFSEYNKVREVPRDIIYSENYLLSSEKYTYWNASINADELALILYPEKKWKISGIKYDIANEIILIKNNNGTEILPPETFRLMVNRVRGWNFLKSNNYSVTQSDGKFIFKGSGLGHGVGMSFEGALQLAERGYSRYEILEHYYPGIKYTAQPPDLPDYRLQYILFDQDTGEVIKTNNPSFHKRIIPCGSILKLFVAFYLSERRRDLFFSHKYNCTGSEKDKLMPGNCWDKHGHGKIDIRGALYNSCNLYFASLYDKIDPADFKEWINEFVMREGIELKLPAVKDGAGFSNFLAGLNFNTTITVDGLIKLNRYIYLKSREKRPEEFDIIFTAVHKTFTDGTAKRGLDDKKNNRLSGEKINISGIWGKTGTVIAGTNSHRGYGIFIGGTGSNGIVSILMNGTGAKTAAESLEIFKFLLTKPIE